MNKLEYNKPEAEVIYIDDVVVTSSGDGYASKNLYDEANYDLSLDNDLYTGE